MIKYRIRKETYYHRVTYHPQKGFLGIWWDMCSWQSSWEFKHPRGFSSYHAANRAICNYKQRKKVEYLEVSCEGDEE